jgi:hypothetical protein
MIEKNGMHIWSGVRTCGMTGGARISSWIGIVMALLMVCAVPSAYAQYENGSVVGTIRDASGATIPNASVTVTNTATSISEKTKTNATGDYDVPQVRVGVYTITASAPGFSDAVAQDITVSIGVRQHIDLVLQVGTAQASVEVSDVALQLETQSSERGQTITNYESESLPLVTRNYSDFLALVPGSRQAPTAALTSSVNSLLRAGSFNVNGERSMFNNFLLDGIDNNAYGESNQGFDNQIIAVPPDSVAQFQVVTNNESAEYGRSSGATVNVASQSGTNKFHATIYEFIRNTDLNAPGFFKPTQVGGSGIVTPFKKPTFNRNQFGFNLGGPIVKNKLFFFLDYEGFRQVLKPLSVLTLPTQNELNGILVVPVKNPITGATYAAGQPVTPNPLSAQIINYFKQSPPYSSLPVSGSATTGLGAGALHRQRRQGRPALRLPEHAQPLVLPAHQRPQGRRCELSCNPNSPGRADQRQDPYSRPADCPGRDAALRRGQGAGCAARPGPHQGRQVQPLHREHGVQQYPWSADGQCGRRRRFAVHRHQRLYGLRPAEHQPAVAGPRTAGPQAELHLGQGQPHAQVRL